MRLVDMREHTQRPARGRIRAHQRECIVGRRTGHGEAVDLAADVDGVRVGIVRDDVWAGRRGRVFEVEVVHRQGRGEASAGQKEE